MQPPTLTQIKSWSSVQFDQLDPPLDDTKVQMLLDRAVDYVGNTTGRPIDDTMPPPLVTTAQDAIQMRVEQRAYQQQTDYTETGADDQVQTFSVTGYSETRMAAGTRITRGGFEAGYPLVNAWPTLNALLWQLMTPDMYDYWRQLLSGINTPDFATTEVDWGNFDGMGSASRLPPGGISGGHLWGA